MSIHKTPERRTMTAEAFLAIPEEGVDRELIRGELRERGTTIRNRFHGLVETLITTILIDWLDTLPKPRGQVLCGDVGFWLRGDSESVIGIDVAYVSADLLAASRPAQMFFEGPPILAVEILSPSDTLENIVEKVKLYHEFGVLVWVADPYFRTIAVHRPGQPVVTYNDRQDLVGDPELPGFRVPVARIFDGS